MSSEHDSTAHSSDRESKRKRDILLRPFRSKKSTVTTNTESQVPKAEQSFQVDPKPPSSESRKLGQALFDGQSSNPAVNSTAHSSDRESKRKRDIFLRPFRSKKSTVTTTNTESQVPQAEQSFQVDPKPPSSESRKLGQALFDGQSSNPAVNQTKSLPQIEDKGNNGVAADGDGSQSQNLWMRAYKTLESRDPDLVADYACCLDSARTSTPIHRSLSPKLIEAIIEQKLQDNEAKKLVFDLGSKSIKVREQGERLIKFILWSDGFISAAVSAQPYAALAWSGVSFLLPLLLNSSKQKEAMLTGLNSIADLLRLYKIREKLYLQAVDKPADPDFVKAIVELYTDILEFQATLIIYLSQSSTKRGIRSTFEWDDWKGMLGRVQSSNARCAEYTALFDKGKEHEFYSEQSSQIEQSVELQRRILEMFGAFQVARQQDRQDDKEAELLRTLASDYLSEKDSISRRIPRTCEWVFEDKKFKKWRDDKKSSLLWISAGPGCGKSVLSRCLIDENRLCTNVMTSTVCYFFFKDGQEQRSNGFNAISAILHQLIGKKSGSSLLSHALSSHKSFGKELQNKFGELWDILIKSARDPDAGEIVCVLDALDECEENARKQLVGKLVDFFSKTDQLENASVTLKFLVTSRPYEDLELGFQPISRLGIFTRFDSDEKSEKIGQEIRLVIDAKVPQIAGDFSVKDRKSISDHLKSLDNQTYLWLFLTIDIIEKSRSKYGKLSSIQKLLYSLPTSVSDAYEKILNRSSDKISAKILLQIVVAARQPLTLQEANIALSIATQGGSCKSHRSLELWPSTSFKSIIQNMCGLFISVYDSKIFLIHQTAREFLLSSPKSGEWKGSLSMTSAHGTISQICLHYLNLQDFASIPQRQLDRYRRFRLEEEYPFLTYAAQTWPFHYASQDSELAENSRKVAGVLCKTSLAQISYWSPIYEESEYVEFLDNWTDLEIATQLGLFHVVEDLLNEGTEVNAVNGSEGTALDIASTEGHEKIVEMLLNRNADVNADGRYYGTALIAAASGGHKKIVEVLLNRNADVNVKVGNGGTALIAAASRGHEKVVEVLLNRNADVNAKGGNYGTALIAAASEGREKVVGVLLNRNADVNADGRYYGTALIAAASGGHEKIVEVLLNRNADVNADGRYYGTALIAAASGGHKKIVEVLLNRNADVNAQGGDYGTTTALIAAAFRGHEEIVKVLLNRNADVNARGGKYGTALTAAASGGHEKIVEVLLNRNADVNAQGGEHGTALIAAASGGHEKIVEVLLNRNADVNAKVGNGGTALIAAASRGHEKVVEVLLNRNADVNVKVGNVGTALIAAAFRGHEKIVEVLLNRNADVNVKVRNGGTALIAAAFRGHEKVVEVLLNRNADVNVKFGNGGTALIAAAFRGHEKIVEMLLNKNADADAKNKRLGTALGAASVRGHESVVEILLSRKATTGHDIALEKASKNLRIGVVEMLLNMMVESNFEVEVYSNALEVALKAVAAAAAKKAQKADGDDDDDEDKDKVEDEDEKENEDEDADEDENEDEDEDENEDEDEDENEDEDEDEDVQQWYKKHDAMIEMLNDRKRKLPTKST